LLTKRQRLRKKRKKKIIELTLFIILTVLILLFVVNLMVSVVKNINKSGSTFGFSQTLKPNAELEITEMLLTPNEYSRPQIPLTKVNGIVIHYTANPGTGAKANRNYFENLRINKTTYASSHFIVGLKGEIIQCIPLDEIAYASNERNDDTISIECCHPDETGKFNKKTYHSLVTLTAWLCSVYNLDKDDIIRHYDVTGKACPLYFVEHEDAWKTFKDDVFKYKKEHMDNQ
jgi:N-acetylmuramoyl-L-alanine amidase